jgi:hypothetical protein
VLQSILSFEDSGDGSKERRCSNEANASREKERDDANECDRLQGERYRVLRCSEGEDSDISTGTVNLLYGPD